MSLTNALKGWCVMANHKVCELCGATYGWGETCDCVKEAEREQVAAQIQKQVQATMKLVLTGGKNGRTSKTKKSRI